MGLEALVILVFLVVLEALVALVFLGSYTMGSEIPLIFWYMSRA